METLSRVLPGLPKSPFKVMVFDALSSSHNLNNSNNRRNHRQARRLDHNSLLNLNLHHNNPNNPLSNRSNPRSLSSLSSPSSLSSLSSNLHRPSMKVHICTATLLRSSRNLPTNTTTAPLHPGATSLNKHLP